MDLSNINNSLGSNQTDPNAKIKITHLKDGRHWRTWIYGLDHFLTEDKKKDFLQLLKKKLGAGLEKQETIEGDRYGFQGDHQDRVKELIKEAGLGQALRSS